MREARCKNYIFYDSIYMKYPEIANSIETVVAWS